MPRKELKRKKRKVQKTIDASKPSGDPKHKSLTGRERGEVEAITARSDLNVRGLLSAKQAQQDIIDKEAFTKGIEGGQPVAPTDTPIPEEREIERDWLGRLPPEERERLLEERKARGSEWEIFKEQLPWNRGEGFGETMKEVGKDILEVSTLGGGGAVRGVGGAVIGTGKKALGKISFKSKREKLLNEVLKGSSQKQIIAKQELMRIWKITDTQASIFINKFNNLKANEILNKLAKTSTKEGFFKGGKVSGGLLKYYTAFAGADVIFAWYSLDNVMTGNKFLVGNIEKGIEEGSITSRAEIDELFADADLARDLAIAKIDQSARYNVFTWAARKLILAGADVDDQVYELSKETLYKKLGF